MNFNIEIDDSDKSNVSIFLKKFPEKLTKHILSLIRFRCNQYLESMEEDEEDSDEECEKDITSLSSALGVAKEFGTFCENKV